MNRPTPPPIALISTVSPGSNSINRVKHVVAGHRLNGKSGTDVEGDRIRQRHEDFGGSYGPFGISATFFDESGHAVAYFQLRSRLVRASRLFRKFQTR